MSNERISEKQHTKSAFELSECPRCHGYGLDPMSIFSPVECPKCHGNGRYMQENHREQETATHRQSDNSNEQRNAWLFS
jgi:DnaJ-class molecular chaperone